MSNSSLITVVVTSLTGIAALIGALWTIYNGRKQNATSATSAMFNEAMQIIDGLKDENQRLNSRVINLEREITQDKKRIMSLERRNRKLIEILSRARDWPVEFTELQFNSDEEEDNDLPRQTNQQRQRRIIGQDRNANRNSDRNSDRNSNRNSDQDGGA